MNEYRVALDIYNGPLDLLLFLIRREELDIYDIPIARITQQYLEYVDVLKEMDPDAVSEFLVLAATLMEIKSRTLLPSPPPDESDDEMVDPRLELVRQLLEYKKFKDAAHYLEESAEVQSTKFPRSATISQGPEEETPLDNLDIWDLVDAFKKILDQTGMREAVHKVGADDTPITLHADDILDSIERAGGSQVFTEIFSGRNKPEMIGLFLALLELMRQHRIRVSQDEPFAPIYIHLLEKKPLDIEAGRLESPEGDPDGPGYFPEDATDDIEHPVPSPETESNHETQ